MKRGRETVRGREICLWHKVLQHSVEIGHQPKLVIWCVWQSQCGI